MSQPYLRVQFWGTRGSIASPGEDNLYYGGNTSCVRLIGVPGHEPGVVARPDCPQIIFDAGTGLTTLQQEYSTGPWARGEGELHLLITHFHWDHILGLPFFFPMFRKGNRLIFHGASVEDLQTSIERLFTSAYSPLKGVKNVAGNLEYRQLDPAGTNIQGFHITATTTKHEGTTLSFKAEWEGYKVVFTPDHQAGDPEIDQRLINQAQGADCWILDGMYTSKERGHYKDWGHSSFKEAVNLALRAQVKKLALFHHYPDHNDSVLHDIWREAKLLVAKEPNAPEIIMSRDGMALDLDRYIPTKASE